MEERVSRKTEIPKRNQIEMREMKESTNQIKQWEVTSAHNTGQKKDCEGLRTRLMNCYTQGWRDGLSIKGTQKPSHKVLTIYCLQTTYLPGKDTIEK